MYREFVKKYTEHELPSSTSLRNKYLDQTFKTSVENVRNFLKGHEIYVSIDGTTDIARGSVAAFVVGSLSDINVGPFLLNLKEMEKGDAVTYHQFFNESLELLYEGTGN